MKDSPDTPPGNGITNAGNPSYDALPAAFSPPPGARYFISTDFDGNDASFIEVPGPKPGTSRLLARDGSLSSRVPATGGHEVSREEFAAFAANFDDPRACIPSRDQFPSDAQFWLKESDVPLVRTAEGWFNWFTGIARPYDATRLRVDNSEEVNFERFIAAVLASIKTSTEPSASNATKGVTAPSIKSLSTWVMLRELGFRPDTLHAATALQWDFGNLKLSATVRTGANFHPVIHLYGPFQSRGSFGFMESDIPMDVESNALGPAFLVHAVDSCAGDPQFVPLNPTPWLDEGRKHQHLLPWMRVRAEELAEYESRPRCLVARDWLRLGIKTVVRELEIAPETKTITVNFDGARLSFQTSAKPLLLPAEGNAWPSAVVISSHGLSARFRRLMNDPVTVEVRGDYLSIDRENIAIIQPDAPAP